MTTRIVYCDHPDCNLPAQYSFKDENLVLRRMCASHAIQHTRLMVLWDEPWGKSSLRLLTVDDVVIDDDDGPGPAPAA